MIPNPDVMAPHPLFRFRAGAGAGAGPVLRFITSRQSPHDRPNYYIRDIAMAATERENAAAPFVRTLTAFPHPYPQLKGCTKQLLRYARDDGLELTATLYLPPGARPPLPLLMWAYPKEFKTPEAAAQVRESPFLFVHLGWGDPLFHLAEGYAVLDRVAMPIVGAGAAEPNDTYAAQLVANAAAAVGAVVRAGVADPRRIAVGGHSYGAFMTANLLSHCGLFCCGIARSGAYNRTLTPFGFQAEERSLWQACDTYIQMSPFTHADRLQAPLLLIHGAEDDNSGTHPLQSERYYAALRGQGKTARLVLLPLEAHHYKARESVCHMLYEQHAWLRRYCGPAGAPAAAAAPGPASGGGTGCGAAEGVA